MLDAGKQFGMPGGGFALGEHEHDSSCTAFLKCINERGSDDSTLAAGDFLLREMEVLNQALLWGQPRKW